MKSKFSTDELEHFKAKLLEKREELIGVVEEFKKEAMRKTMKSDETGDLTNMPTHIADIGSDIFEQEMNLGQMEREREIIRQIDEAIERIADKKYGICENDNRVISKQRLEAVPWARYCLECEAKVEKSRVKRSY